MHRMSEQTENELVARAKAGDKNAFNELATWYRPWMYQYAMNWLGDHDKAEDATQKALIFAWERIGAYEQRPGKFVHWLIANTRNRNREVARGYKGKQERRVWGRIKAEREANMDLGGLEGPRWSESIEDIGAPICQETAEDGHEAKILECLPPMQKRVMELTLDGRTVKEIVNCLGISENAVRVNLCRAREVLKGDM